MAVQFIGYTFTNHTDNDGSLVLTLPSYQTGDLIITLSGHDGVWPEQAIPTGYTKLNNFPSKEWAAATNSETSQDYWYSMVAYRLMTDTANTTVTWNSAYGNANGPAFGCAVCYRGALAPTNYEGRSTNGSASTNRTVPARTGFSTGSWGLIWNMNRTGSATEGSYPTECSTRRVGPEYHTSPYNYSFSLFDSNGGISGISGETLTGWVNSGYFLGAVEIPTASNLSLDDNPDDQVQYEGINVSFQVAATDAVTYVWQEYSAGSWSNVGSNANVHYNVVHRDDNGNKYRCVVSDGSTELTSNIANLTVAYEVSQSIIII